MAKTRKLTEKSIKVNYKAKILYIFLVPMFISTIISLFHGDYGNLAIKVVGFIVFFSGIKLIDKGLEIEANFKKSKVAKAPLLKHKLLGYLTISLDLVFLSLNLSTSTLINSIIVAAIAFIGLVLFYGVDPIKSKLPKGDSLNIDRFLKELEEAQVKLDYIKHQSIDIEDENLKNTLTDAHSRASDILQTIKDDPKDIRVARKFMVVYLDGVKDVIESYNSIDKKHLDASYTKRLTQTLDLATDRFDKELKRLKSNEIFDLDVQIDALKEQLKH